MKKGRKTIQHLELPIVISLVSQSRTCFGWLWLCFGRHKRTRSSTCWACAAPPPTNQQRRPPRRPPSLLRPPPNLPTPVRSFLKRRFNRYFWSPYNQIWIFNGFYRVLLGFTRFYWGLLGFTEFYSFLLSDPLNTAANFVMGSKEFLYLPKCSVMQIDWHPLHINISLESIQQKSDLLKIYGFWYKLYYPMSYP